MSKQMFKYPPHRKDWKCSVHLSAMPPTRWAPMFAWQHFHHFIRAALHSLRVKFCGLWLYNEIVILEAFRAIYNPYRIVSGPFCFKGQINFYSNHCYQRVYEALILSSSSTLLLLFHNKGLSRFFKCFI